MYYKAILNDIICREIEMHRTHLFKFYQTNGYLYACDIHVDDITFVLLTHSVFNCESDQIPPSECWITHDQSRIIKIDIDQDKLE